MGKTAYILLAEGFEEIEAITPADILRRMDVNVVLVGVSSKLVRGAHGMEITADATLNRASAVTPDAVILPGGMPGAKNLDACRPVRELVAKVNENGGIVAAICAAPMVLGRMGLLEGKSATCYPGFEEHLSGAAVTKESVTRDGNFVTANGPGAAAEFGFTLGAMLTDDVTAAFVRRSMQYK
ncbi:MAG: DJ-1/PfpI family protein [Clostridia bacterium]|nr:DJ-1/PfpI family protein [Clostridia bacterium]